MRVNLFPIANGGALILSSLEVDGTEEVQTKTGPFWMNGATPC